MDVSSPSFWWVAAGVLVAAELATGTFYLLMIALGVVAAALAAHLGLGVAAELVVAAAVGGAATALLHWQRRRAPAAAPASRNRDVNLDIGERVKVDAWGRDLTARVQHRGSVWGARLAPGAPALPGEHLITAVEGNWLVLAPAGDPPSSLFR